MGGGYGRWPNTSAPSYSQMSSDHSHSGAHNPPTGLSMQQYHGIDFGGSNKRFFPQFGDDKSLWPKQNALQYFQEHGFEHGLDAKDQAETGVIQAPNKKREEPVMGETDFIRESENEYGSTYIGWYRGDQGIWSPGGQDLNPGPADPLEFVWAAPYVVWQHYQRSGSD